MYIPSPDLTKLRKQQTRKIAQLEKFYMSFDSKNESIGPDKKNDSQ